MHMKIRRIGAAVAATALAVTGLTVVVAPPAQALQGTVPGITSPTWQTNGTVRALAAVNGMLYVGGEFTSVRPPGAAAGSGEVTRTRIARFSTATGALDTTWVHTANGTVRDLAASPDGSLVYMSGDFTTVDGVTRNRVAAFSTATGALTSFAPTVNASIYGIAVSPTRVYLAGNFTRLAGVDTARVGAVTLTGGGVPGFVANADRIVYDLALSPAYDKLYIAGGFITFNGDAAVHGAAAASAETGATLPLPAAQQAIPDYTPSCITELKTVTVDDDAVYFGSEGTGGGCFDGTFAARHSDGSFVWKNNCLGATQGIAVLDGFLYTGSHAHDCVSNTFDPDAFPEVGWSRGLARHLMALNIADGTTGPWHPNTNGGPNSSGLGPRVMATDGTQIFVGGEFTTVNGATQQGFTRFAPLANGASAVPSRPSTPRAVALPGGAIAITAQAGLDLDDVDVTVRLYRDGGATPVASQDVRAIFWRNPTVTFIDTGLAPNSLHTYTVDVIEKNGTQASQKSPTSAQVRSVATVGSYQTAVNADNPTFLWRLGEPAGPVAADSSAGAQGGQYWRPFTFGAAGPIAGETTAVTTNGIDNVISSNKFSSPSTFTAEAWFKTTTTTGGKIIGFGNRQNGYDFSGNPGMSGSYDKHVYMTNDGRLVFGVYNGRTDTVTSPTPLNDDQWHHVVATQGPKGMALYVDGAAVGKNGITTNQAYDGYWRVGGDNLNGWPNRPTSNFFAGTIANVAVYPTALSLTSVRDHYSAAGYTPPVIPLPADAYGQAVYADEPVQYLRLDEPSGTAVADASNNGATAQAIGSVTRGTAGALPAGTASSFASGGYVTSDVSSPSPSTYSVEAWFSTTSTTGGKIIGFGNNRTGNSGSYDKHIYLTNDGRLVFGVYTGGFQTIVSGPGLNNGVWHHVVGTQGPDGMKLYVDDNLVGTNGTTSNQSYTGYWRLGGDNLGAWPNRPATDYLTGSIDDAAVYSTVLSPAQVETHYLASGRVPNDTTNPTVSVTSPVDGASVDVGVVTITANATDNAAVASVEFFVDATSIGTDSSAPYEAAWTATAGPHTISAVATDSSGNTGTSAVINVTGVVPDTTDPSVTIDSPGDGAGLLAGAIPVTASATDDTAVTSVEFFVDGVSIGTDSSAPYEVTWNAATAGSRVLTATASDAAGNTGTSPDVTVTITVPDTTAPDVSITSPADGATIATGPTTVEATATDNTGVTSVEFFVDGVSIGDDSTSPYAADWTPAEGVYALTAVASDAAGNTGTSSVVDVTVVAPDTTDPSVEITAPAEGATPYGAVTITADATDNIAVDSVEFFVDGVSIGSDGSEPYSRPWNATDEGSHVLTAVATDTAGNTGSSVAVNVTVPTDTTDPSAPTGLAASNVTQTSLTLTWNAATDDRGVVGYEVSRDGGAATPVAGTSLSVTGLTAATAYDFVVRAVDAAGNASADSDELTVTTESAGPSSLYTDNWANPNNSPWDSAWTVSTSNGTVDTQGGAGRLAFNDVAGAYARAQLTGVAPRSDLDITLTYQWSSTSARSFLDVWTRGSGGWANSYRPRNGYGVEVSSTSGSVSVLRSVNGAQTTLASVAGGQSVSTNPQKIRLRVQGSTIQVKTWLASQPEPTAWRSTVTDTQVSADGQLFLSVNRAGVNVGAKSVTIDDLTVTAAN
jgi:chitodextrinase